MMLSVAVIVLLGTPLSASSRGVIVHLFEWKYSDIALECEEFLGPRGFWGIQISPPSENLVVAGRPWWERYQPVSYQLTTRSGDLSQLRDMLTRCNKAGVRVIADTVINHMTGSAPECRGTQGSGCSSQSLSYPAVPYSAEDFHHPLCGINNYKNAYEVRNCELVGLHDLNQTREHVRDSIVKFMNHLIELGVYGFRIDAAKHMNPSDLAEIYKRLKKLNTSQGFPANSTPFIYQEVIDMGGEGVRYQEYTPMGLVTDLRFGRELGRCFQGRNSLKWLKNFGSAWNLIPDNESLVFLENHDSERSSDDDIVTYKKSRSYKMAIAFMLGWGYGWPKVLSSYQFSQFDQGPPHDSTEGTLSPRPIQDDVCSNGWLCQHRWRQIYNMVDFYNTVAGTAVTSWWDNGKDQISFCRGNKGFVAFNAEQSPLNQTLQTCLPQGSYCDVISGNMVEGECSGKVIQVARDGRAQITIGKFDPGQPDDGIVAIHVKAHQSMTKKN